MHNRLVLYIINTSVSLNKPYVPAVAPSYNVYTNVKLYFYSGKEKYRIQIGNPLSKKKATKSLNQAWAGTRTAFEAQRCEETLVRESST